VSKDETFKIPCGDKPERYPRTNAKKFRESSLWERMGPGKRKQNKSETNKTKESKQ